MGSPAGGELPCLRTHIEHFPNGAYRDAAVSMLAARRVTKTEDWMPSTRRLVQFEPPGDVASVNETTARSAALVRAQARAEHLCKGFAVTTSFRLKSASLLPQSWSCNSDGNGVTCGFEGEAVCSLEERRIEE